MANPKSLANLTPFKAGAEWTGNRKGRPPKRPITDRLREWAERPLDAKTRKRFKLPATTLTYGDALALIQFQESFKGRTMAAKEIREAIEGKATSRIEVIGSDTDEQPNLAMTIAKIREFYGLEEPKLPCRPGSAEPDK